MERTIFKKLHLRILDLAVISLAMASLLPFAGRLHWRIDLFSHFRTQYFIGLAALLLISLLVGNRRGAIIALVFALLNAALIAPLYLPQHRGPEDFSGESYRLLLANVNTSNRSYNTLRDLIGDTRPDIILLLEIDQGWLKGLSLSELGYAHTETRPQIDNFGVGLFSRHPLISSGILINEASRTTGVIARTELNGQLLTLIGIHPPPPVTSAATARRDRQIRDSFGMATAYGGAAILAGDFNATSWGQSLAKPLADSGLGDSRAGFGPQATWPTFWPAILRIPIDHVFISKNVRILDRVIGPEIGSDHLPLWVDFGFSGKEQ